MIRTEELLLNVGPQHPSTHGVFRIIVKLDGEVITEATPVMGYLHRGTEKLAEDLNYTQIIPYTDRMDYVSAMTTNYVLCHAVETMMGLEIPDPCGIYAAYCDGAAACCQPSGLVGNLSARYRSDEPVPVCFSRPGNHH